MGIRHREVLDVLRQTQIERAEAHQFGIRGRSTGIGGVRVAISGDDGKSGQPGLGEAAYSANIASVTCISV